MFIVRFNKVAVTWPHCAGRRVLPPCAPQIKLFLQAVFDKFRALERVKIIIRDHRQPNIP